MQPRASGWSSAITPLPLVVVSTGACRASANLRTAETASSVSTPEPVTTTGLRLCSIWAMAFASCCSAGIAAGPCGFATASAPVVIGSNNTSWGTSMNAGPSARAAAAATSSISSGELTLAAKRVSGLMISSCCGVSCRAPQRLSSTRDATLVPIRINGVFVCKLSSRPTRVNRFPGPVEAKTAAGFPLRRQKPSAAKAAACSWRTIQCWNCGCCRNASYKATLWMLGMPNPEVIPLRSRASTSAAAALPAFEETWEGADIQAIM